MRVILLMLACLLVHDLGAQSYTGKSYALFFANNDYSGNPEFDSLRNPIKDAEAIAKELRDMYGYTEVKVLKDLTRQEIFNELELWQARQFQAQDQLFVFFSGHGSFREFTKKGYYAPKTNSGDYSAYIDLTDLANIVTQIPAPHILLCIDACYSGTIDREIAFRSGRDFTRPGVTEQTQRDVQLSTWLRNKSRLLLTSGGKERTPDGTDHSPLAEALLEALRDAYSPHNDGMVTYEDLLAKMMRVRPTPHHGEFYGHKQGSFVFVATKVVPKPPEPKTPSNTREAWGNPTTGEVWGSETSSVTIPIQQLLDNMVHIEGGTFTIGSEEGRKLEKSGHDVVVSDFFISKYEVTQAQWRAVMGSDPSRLQNKGCDDCPVEGVSWNEVQEFIQELNEQTGRRYRLPTEAEWEYAARGGNKSNGYLYSGSNNIDEVAWYNSNANPGNTHGSEKTTRPVGGKKPNELDLYDMTGNVREWTSGSESENISKGGSWKGNMTNCKIFDSYSNTRERDEFTGFRLACDK